MSQNRVLIDLTDIAQWAGHHGGTQRVVYGIAKNYFLDENVSVKFFTYSSHSNEFIEADFKPIFDRVENTVIAAGSRDSVKLSQKLRIKTLILPYVPKAVLRNEELKKKIKSTIRTGIHNARAIKGRIKGVYAQAKSTVVNSEVGRTVIFKENDIVLILGKPWDEPKLQSLLDEKKSQIGFKVVELVYDLIISLYPHLHHPSLFKRYTQQMFKAGQASDLLLSISESSKNDFLKLSNQLELTPPPIDVIRLGDEVEISMSDDDLNAINLSGYGVEEEYLLCVGTVENRKNHALLYYTYKLAHERGITLPQLIIIGGNGWLSDDIQYLIRTDPALKEKIKIFSNINDVTLAALYKRTLFTVYPSFYEGWGLPVAEALAYGKVCVASKYSSIPEVGGDLVTYFSPYSTDECLAAIVKMLNVKNRTALEARISREYKMTTWHDTYTQVKLSLEKL